MNIIQVHEHMENCFTYLDIQVIKMTPLAQEKSGFNHSFSKLPICYSYEMSRIVRKPTMFPTRSDINLPVQTKRKARISKFWVQVEEELYYPCNKNKGADLRLCFRIGKNPFFS